MKYYSEHPKMYVAVDCIIFGFDKGELRVLIGRRKMDPGRGEWSLYGGFVDTDESVEDAARRVLYGLTGLKGLYLKQVGVFGDVDRDPGERVVSVAYYSMINVADYDPAQQELHGVEWVNIISHEPISFNLLPELFTLAQLQSVYEAVCGETVDKRNFRKRIKDMDFIEKTTHIDKLTSKRGAYLYRFNEKAYNEEDTNFKL